MPVNNGTSSSVSSDLALTSVTGQMPSLLLHHSIASLGTTAKTTTAASAADNSDFLLRQQVNWYMVIAILSALVLVGMCFTICRLVMKATAHEKAGLDWHRDSLLYSRKDSIIPISLHFDQSDDANGP